MGSDSSTAASSRGGGSGATKADVELASAALTVARHVGRERAREVRKRQRLQPDLARTSELGKKQRVRTEQHVLDALHALDLERHRTFEQSDVPEMHLHHLAGRQLVLADHAVDLDPGFAGA